VLRAVFHIISDKRFNEYIPSRPLIGFGFFSCFVSISCSISSNNAEHAIIPFAKYRTYRDKHFSEGSIKDYLTLLSIQQTCKYRGVKFLDFLRSGTESIEDFCK
jgi:hypothetical protein